MIMEENKIKKEKEKEKEKSLQNVKSFCRVLENNYNSMNINNMTTAGHACAFEFSTVNGIKRKPKSNDNKAFVRFFLNFFNDKKEFIGFTTKSGLIKTGFSDTGYLELSQSNNTFMYFFSSDSFGQVLAVLEVIYIELNDKDDIVEQSTEGWGFYNVTNPSDKQFIDLHQGSPRNLKFQQDLIRIEGGSISFNFHKAENLNAANFLLPCFIAVQGWDNKETSILPGTSFYVPGLKLGYFPKIYSKDYTLVLSEFYDVFLKNIELELPDGFEKQALDFANTFFIKKHSLQANATPQITVKDRKLKVSVHNTWKFLNSNENAVSLILRETTLISKNVQCLDKYLFDLEMKCGLVFELIYTYESNIQQNSIAILPVAQGFYIPGKITMENFYSSIYLSTKGENLNGEKMACISISKPLRLNFIISQNKDSYDKTYKEQEIAILKDEIVQLHQKLADETKKNLIENNQNTVKKSTSSIEEKIIYLQEKLLARQKALKMVYEKEDKNVGFTITINNNKANNSLQKQTDEMSAKPHPEPPAPTQILTQNNTLRPNNILSQQTVQANEQVVNINKSLTGALASEPKNVFQNSDTFRNTNQLQQPESYTQPLLVKPGITISDQSFMPEIKNDLYNLTAFGNTSLGGQKTNELNTSEFTQRNNHPATLNPSLSQQMMNSNFNLGAGSNNLDQFNLADLSKEQLLKIIISKELALLNQQPQPMMGVNPAQYQYSQFNDVAGSRNIYYDIKARDISDKDKAELVSKGAMSLESEEQNENLIQFSLETELKDEKKGVNYLLHFVAFKPNKDILGSINSDSLTKLNFKFAFWDEDQLESEIAVIQKPENKIYTTSIPFVLMKQDYLEDKNIKIKHCYDPFNDVYSDYREFIWYLVTKSLFVIILDADRLFRVGYFKIPLKDFLRNAKTNKSIQKEYEVFDFSNHESKGYLLMNVQISGFSSRFEYIPNKFKQIANLSNSTAMTKKKKVSVKPMNIENLSRQEKEVIGAELLNKAGFADSTAQALSKPIKLNVDPETQKKLRVLKYSNLMNKQDKGISKPVEIGTKINQERLDEMRSKQEKEDKYFSNLDLACKLKEMKKNVTIKNTIEENNKSHLSVSLIAGRQHYFNYIIKNESTHEEIFHVIVSNPVEQSKKTNFTSIASENCVSVVTDPVVWKKVIENEKHNLSAPANSNFDALSSECYFVLKPEEKMPILIKMLSYDQSVSNKNYTVWIYKGKDPLEYLSITVVKVAPIVDHIFEFDVPDNRTSLLTIPNVYKTRKQNEDISEKLIECQVSSHSAYSLALDSVSKDFLIKFKPGEVNDNTSLVFNIYLYANELKLSLLCTWEIRIKSHETIDVQVQLGSKVLQKFFIESNERATVQCFASDPNLVYFTDKNSVPIILVPEVPNEIKFVVFPKKKEGNNQVLINVVEITHKIVIKSVLVRIIPEIPVFSHVVRIDCNIGSSTHFKYEYMSKLSRWAIIKFESNDEEYLRIIDSTLNFNPKEAKQISMVVPDQKQRGVSEVIVFISDSEEYYSETILFQFHFK